MTKGSTYQQRGKQIDVRFDEKVNKTEHCWEWTSAKIQTGYGVFYVSSNRKIMFAHRFAWERANKTAIPDGCVVMHLCNNKGCVNPLHLVAGTPKENTLAAARDGLMPTGERNGGGKKLKEQQVKEILSDRSLGCLLASRKYGVSTQTIKAIRRRRIWKCVDHPATT
jgi:hypothetical protein